MKEDYCVDSTVRTFMRPAYLDNQLWKQRPHINPFPAFRQGLSSLIQTTPDSFPDTSP
jgi:hypothetical protein